MKSVSDELSATIDAFFTRHESIDDGKASVRLSDDKWSLKEIIGHLIDSASNNHQRFVRLQRDPVLVFPEYHYDWIKTEKFNSMRFGDLLLLWKQYNLLLAHLIADVKPGVLSHVWKTGGKEITLEFLMKDYLRHLKDHVKHFEDRLAELG
jgi:hypothetical protein